MCNFSFPKNVRVSGKTSPRANGSVMYSAADCEQELQAFFDHFIHRPMGFTVSDGSEDWEQWKEYVEFLKENPNLGVSFVEYVKFSTDPHYRVEIFLNCLMAKR